MNVTHQKSAWVRASGFLHRFVSGLALAALSLRPAGHQAARATAGAARCVARALAECHRAQRDLALLRLQPDRYDRTGDCPPDTYAEFLFRSPGTVWHEPSARERAESTPRKPFGRGF